MKINNIQPIEAFGKIMDEKKITKGNVPGFQDSLSNSIKQVNELQNKAHIAMENLASGKSHNLHETMIAIEQAEIAFKMMAQVRNKIMAAYNEIQRFQL